MVNLPDDEVGNIVQGEFRDLRSFYINNIQTLFNNINCGYNQ